LDELKDNPDFNFYIGETKMHDLSQEDLRWLIARGANLPPGQGYEGQRNRPVLLNADDTTITMKTAREQHGFLSEVVYESTALINASMVEDALQSRFQYLRLGYRRLWRDVAKGKRSDKEDVHETEVYKVFVTYSTTVVSKLEDGSLKIEY